MYHPISHAQRKTTPNFLPTLRNLRSGCDRSERTRLWAWLDFSRHGENPWKCPIQRAWPRTTTSRIHLGSPSLNAEVHKHQVFQRKETHDKLVKNYVGSVINVGSICWSTSHKWMLHHWAVDAVASRGTPQWTPDGYGTIPGLKCAKAITTYASYSYILWHIMIAFCSPMCSTWTILFYSAWSLP